MEYKKSKAIEYARDNNLSVEEAFRQLNTKEFESNRPEDQNLDPNTVREDISHKQWRKLTCNTEAPRCEHTTYVNGCTDCEYNANQDVPTSCTHGANPNPSCHYCESTKWGSSSEDET